MQSYYDLIIDMPAPAISIEVAGLFFDKERGSV